MVLIGWLVGFGLVCFLSLNCQNTRFSVNSAVQTSVSDKNNSVSVQHFFSPCFSGRDTRQSVN